VGILNFMDVTDWLTRRPGEVHWCDCEKGQQRRELSRETWRALLRARIDEHFLRAGVPPRFQGLTLETFPTSNGKETALKAAEEWCTTGSVTCSRGMKRGILLWGETGVGKTGLVAPLANDRLEMGMSVLFHEYYELMAEIQSRYNGDGGWQQLVRTAQEVDLLVLDDLGRQMSHRRGDTETRDKMEKLYRIISYRHGKDLPTLITTNLDPQGLAEFFGPAIRGRIVEMCAVVKVGGRNLRE